MSVFPFMSVPPLRQGQSLSRVARDLADMHGCTAAEALRLLGQSTLPAASARMSVDLFPTKAGDIGELALVLAASRGDVERMFLLHYAPTATSGLTTAKGFQRAWPSHLLRVARFPVCSECWDDDRRDSLDWRLGLIPLCLEHRALLTSACNNCGRQPGGHAGALRDNACCATPNVDAARKETPDQGLIRACSIVRSLATAQPSEESVESYRTIVSLARLVIMTGSLVSGQSRREVLVAGSPAPSWMAAALPGLVTCIDSSEAAAAEDVVSAASSASNASQRQKALQTRTSRDIVDLARNSRPLVLPGSHRYNRNSGQRHLDCWTSRMHLVPRPLYRDVAALTVEACIDQALHLAMPELEGRRAVAQAVALLERQQITGEELIRLRMDGLETRRPLRYVLDGASAAGLVLEWSSVVADVAERTAGQKFRWRPALLSWFHKQLHRLDPKGHLDRDAAVLWVVEDELCCLPDRLKWDAPRLRKAASRLALYRPDPSAMTLLRACLDRALEAKR